MKKINLFLIVLLALLMLSSCATGTDIKKKNADGSPIWTTEIPKSSKYIYGVGKAKLLIASNSEAAADAAARSDLALKINVNIKDALASYTNEAADGVVTAYETILVQSVNLTMKNVVVEERWTAPDGTVWSLVSFKVKDLPSLYSDAANDYLNQLEEKKANTQSKLLSLLSEISKSGDDDAAEMKTLAEEKADEIVTEVVEIEKSINVDDITKEIEKYLSESGYTLSED